MRVLLITSGSTGDVAPYTGLGRSLADAGHDVTIATHEPFRALIAMAGLGFVPIPGDVREILPRAGSGARSLTRLRSLARPLIDSLADGVHTAVSSVRPDALLLSTLVAPLGYQVGDAFGIPYAGVFPQPLHPTGAFGPVLTGGHSLGRPVNLALGRLATVAARPMYATAIHDLRRELGLPRASLGALQSSQQGRGPTFHGFSPAVVPRPPDWPAPMRVTGYWWPAVPPNWQPPSTLIDFLEAGPPPAYVGFGSMIPGQDHGNRGLRLAETAVAAARRAGLRLVLQAGWSGMSAAPAPDVLSIGEVPHEWLFPRMAVVVHHAGAGTTAAGLRAGVPAVAVPVIADQPFWANRMHRLGVAPPPLPMHRLSADRLATSLVSATADPHRSARAKALSARLRSEDGTAPIRTWLEGVGS